MMKQPDPASDMQPGRLPALDGIRGVAILLVLSIHLFAWDRPGIRWIDAFYRVLSAGWIGVDLFFVLSGFLITGILIRARGRDRYFINFYARRAVRILPLYYGMIFVGLVYAWLRPLDPAVQSFWTNQKWLWTYLANYPDAADNRMVLIRSGRICFDMFWSLAIEEHFYLVWPVIVWACPLRWLGVVCVGLAVVLLASRAAYVHATGRCITAYVATPFRLDGLLLGSAAAVWVRSSRFVDFCRRRAWWGIALTAVVSVAGYLPTGWQIDTAFVASIGFTLLAVAGTVLVVVCCAAPRHHPIRRAFELPLLRFFGKYSYGLYALNLTVFDWLLYRVSVPVHARLHSVLFSALVAKLVTLAACVVAAMLSWHLYEKHFLRLKRFFRYPALASPRQSLVPAEGRLA
jgi:peptidoglycan/LPS O-acetylase OafA/YrhL